MKRIAPLVMTFSLPMYGSQWQQPHEVSKLDWLAMILNSTPAFECKEANNTCVETSFVPKAPNELIVILSPGNKSIRPAESEYRRAESFARKLINSQSETFTKDNLKIKIYRNQRDGQQSL